MRHAHPSCSFPKVLTTGALRPGRKRLGQTSKPYASGSGWVVSVPIALTRGGWTDTISRRYAAVQLIRLQPLFRCTRCQNKGDNRFIIGPMTRD